MDMWCFIVYAPLVMTVSVPPPKDDPPDFWPAFITGSPTVRAGGDIQLKCATIDSAGSSDQVLVYLCKNGVGMRIKMLGNEKEHNFILRNASKLDSGNYSCVYSFHKHLPKNVTGSGYNSIHVQVTETSESPPKDILLVKKAVIQSGRVVVKKGEDIELNCSISGYEKPALLHVYICKDGIGKISETVYNQSQTQFSIKSVNLEDSGVYSCLYSAEQYDISEVYDTERENSILIQVYDPQEKINFIRLICSSGVVIFACLMVIFDVYLTKRGYSAVLDSAKAATSLESHD